ncbi:MULTISPECIES: hypothetical protein [Metallosphaera]|uniref:Uncharacterized protein n=3 Tax=Metallosphaera TaxID=41980 RepID=A4YDI6_METS5|nr:MULTISPECIES: hypothetical protein [Metallosphaera]ABP94488.1 hypothetical protein Msed_0311 [Metallosphaera sedula DSM 5348]AIM26475.1 hypothetical protein HA72_0311 [Metallosphaera sedula]AKV73471.1 hypothetical protein MsedA_0323 [Metallosphaera sedula]AKV75713.1 hypothetical protein MsedB_0323 [Metallosphaera sedula]AKV77960.1 hypothetical protein MsedC_0322 [Metallosphaera sedula]
MTLFQEVDGLIKGNRPLFAMMLIKQFVEDHQLENPSKECEEIFRAVKVMPWMNDESWRYFAPSLPEDEIKTLALKVQDCARIYGD